MQLSDFAKFPLQEQRASRKFIELILLNIVQTYYVILMIYASEARLVINDERRQGSVPMLINLLLEYLL